MTKCQAYTHSGKKCKNHAREGCKNCGIHKGQRGGGGCKKKCKICKYKCMLRGKRYRFDTSSKYCNCV